MRILSLAVPAAVFALLPQPDHGNSVSAAQNQVVAALAQELSSPFSNTRVNAATALGQLGPGAAPAVPELAFALKDTDLEVRRAAALALAKIGPPAAAAVPALVAALDDPDNTEQAIWTSPIWQNLPIVAVPQRALLALGRMGPKAKAAMPALWKPYKDPARNMKTHEVAFGRWDPRGDEMQMR